jgi:hypothetical protein
MGTIEMKIKTLPILPIDDLAIEEFAKVLEHQAKTQYNMKTLDDCTFSYVDFLHIKSKYYERIIKVCEKNNEIPHEDYKIYAILSLQNYKDLILDCMKSYLFVTHIKIINIYGGKNDCTYSPDETTEFFNLCGVRICLNKKDDKNYFKVFKSFERFNYYYGDFYQKDKNVLITVNDEIFAKRRSLFLA